MKKAIVAGLVTVLVGWFFADWLYQLPEIGTIIAIAVMGGSIIIFQRAEKVDRYRKEFMIMYTHVIFDLDGTLLDTIDDLADAGNHVCQVHGWPTHTVDQFKHMVGNGIPNLVKHFTPDGLGPEELAQALAEFSAYYGEHKADKTAPYPGVPELLAALKEAGACLAVLSNKAHALAGPVVEGYFPGVFDAVQGALPDAPLKPDPTLLRALMETIGGSPETTLFVGDSDVDVLTGKNGGLTVCGVLWGFRDREELEDAGADRIIDDPVQLLQLVKR